MEIKPFILIICNGTYSVLVMMVIDGDKVMIPFILSCIYVAKDTNMNVCAEFNKII